MIFAIIKAPAAQATALGAIVAIHNHWNKKAF